jgi:hypothetical protein
MMFAVIGIRIEASLGFNDTQFGLLVEGRHFLFAVTPDPRVLAAHAEIEGAELEAAASPLLQ